MAGATNKSAKRLGYTKGQIQTERAKGGVLSLASLMARVDPARPTKAYHARKEDEGNTAPLYRSGISKGAVAQIKARGVRSSPADIAAQKAASARNQAAAANMKPELRAKMERLAAQQSRRDAVATSRSPKVTWGEKVAASRKKTADAFSVANLMKRSEPKAPAAPTQSPARTISPRRPSGKQRMQLAFERRTGIAGRPDSLHAKLGIRPRAA